MLSNPANCEYFFIRSATVWSVNLYCDNFDPFENLLNKAPELILDISIQFFKEITGQYFELSK